KAIEHFRAELDKPLSPARRNGSQYGLAIAMQRNTEYEEAEELLSSLLEEEPNRLAFQLQMADLQRQRGQHQQAIEALDALHQVFPGNRAIAMEYARALLEQDDPALADTASTVLKQQLTARKNDPALYALYARASSLAGDEVRATEAIAESYYLRGGTEEAITQLESLEKRDDLDYYQRARVSARLMELRIEQKEAE
ncbi:MAG: tetratricopeptide repeat protein, partial [Lysobacterales bacterium]